MATSIQYGTTAPGGTDPYPVETALATEVGKNSPQEAYNLLNMYGIQNMVGTDNYNASLQGQHDFARQQLQQQLYENNLKAAGEAVKTPGALSFYGSSPMYGGVLGGADPGVVGGIETNLRSMQLAEQAQKGGAGAASFTAAGAQPNQEGMDVLSGGTAGNVGTPIAIQVAQMKLQGDLARAAARKASGSGFGLSIPLAPQAKLGGAAPSMTIPKGLTVDQGLAWAKAQGLDIGDNAVVPPGGSTQRSVPDLPMAKTDTGKGVPNATPKGGDIHAQAESYVENVVRQANPKIYQDIVAGKVGGRVNVVVGSDGKPHIKGKVGTY